MIPSALRASSRTDEELGKRDDDYVPSGGHHRDKSSSGGQWHPAAPEALQQKWRRRRQFVWFLLAAAALYLFIRNMPTDLTPAAQRNDWRVPKINARRGSQIAFPNGPPPRAGRGSSTLPKGAPPRPDGRKSKAGAGAGNVEAEENHYYAGPIRFYELKASLDSILPTAGFRQNNRNVLFAAASLRSAANLLPLACEMASLDHSIVHMALLGRASLPLADVLSINGVDKDSCNVYFHDARPDFSEYSTDLRAQASVVGALNHINTYMHPQVIITDAEAVEDAFFTKGVRGKARELDRPIIEIPAGKYEHFRWISSLDPTSLSNWHKPRVEILVHSPPSAGGGLVRLLKSLSEADLAGFKPPRLTIELPARVDGYLRAFLWDFRWPSSSDSSNLLKVQRRASSSTLDQEESSIRFIESYYPSRSADDHVLILSANAAVSPLFYHYLMYTLLSTKYGQKDEFLGEFLGGFTLATPATTIDGLKKLDLPTFDQMSSHLGADVNADATTPPFLWQAPQADSILVFGDRWVEFHDFLSRRLDKLHKPTKGSVKSKKLIGMSQPAWLEFLLELTRARGWNFLYPATTEAGVFATIHSELYKPPEEFRELVRELASKETNHPRDTPAKNSEPFLTSDASPEALSFAEAKTISPSQPLHKLLPFNGSLPALGSLPLLSWDGTVTRNSAAREAAVEYATLFRRQKGGCDAAAADEPKKSVLGRAGDLFCYDNKEGDEWDGTEIDYAMFMQSERLASHRDDDEDDTLVVPVAKVKPGAAGGSMGGMAAAAANPELVAAGGEALPEAAGKVDPAATGELEQEKLLENVDPA